MNAFIGWRNALDGATQLSSGTSADPAFDADNITDYRLDTCWKPETATSTYSEWDMQQTLIDNLNARGTLAAETDKIATPNGFMHPEGFYDLDAWAYTLTINSGTSSGDVRSLIGYEANNTTGHDYTLQVDSDFTVNPDNSSYFTLTRIPKIDYVAFIGHNCHLTTCQMRLLYSDDGAAWTQYFSDYSESNRILARDFGSVQTHRYWRVSLISHTNTNFLCCVFMGKRTDLDTTLELTLRAPYIQHGIYQPKKNKINVSNAGSPFPASVRTEPFSVSIPFEHIDAAYLQGLIGAGMFAHMESKPFIIARSATNVNTTNQYRYNDAAFCWVDKSIEVPTTPEYNGRMKWKLKAKGLTEL